MTTALVTGASGGIGLEIARVVEQVPAVDVLVNNAGVGDFAPFAESDPARLDTQVALNIGALTQLSRAYLPGMLERARGRILNVASTAAFQPGPLMAAMNRGEVVAIPGVRNKLLASSVRFTPRAVVRRLVHQMQRAG